MVLLCQITPVSQRSGSSIKYVPSSNNCWTHLTSNLNLIGSEQERQTDDRGTHQTFGFQFQQASSRTFVHAIFPFCHRYTHDFASSPSSSPNATKMRFSTALTATLLGIAAALPHPVAAPEKCMNIFSGGKWTECSGDMTSGHFKREADTVVNARQNVTKNGSLQETKKWITSLWEMMVSNGMGPNPDKTPKTWIGKARQITTYLGVSLDYLKEMKTWESVDARQNSTEKSHLQENKKWIQSMWQTLESNGMAPSEAPKTWRGKLQYLTVILGTGSHTMEQLNGGLDIEKRTGNSTTNFEMTEEDRLLETEKLNESARTTLPINLGSFVKRWVDQQIKTVTRWGSEMKSNVLYRPETGSTLQDRSSNSTTNFACEHLMKYLKEYLERRQIVVAMLLEHHPALATLKPNWADELLKLANFDPESRLTCADREVSMAQELEDASYEWLESMSMHPELQEIMDTPLEEHPEMEEFVDQPPTEEQEEAWQEFMKMAPSVTNQIFGFPSRRM